MFFSFFRQQKLKRKQKAPAIVAGLTVALVILSILGIGLLFSSLSKPADAAWFDDNWLYRNAIPISSHTAAEAHVYISVTIDTSTAGQFKPNCGDLRFTDYAGKQLPYFISSGCGSASTVIHIFFQTFPAGAQTIYYYYGNPSAPNGFVATDFSTQASSYVVGSVATQEKGGGPVGYWKFDEGSGSTTKDSSPQQNNGSITGATWQSDDQCVTGKCLKFNGSSDYVNAGNPTGLRLNTDMTAEVWVKFNYLDYTGNTGSLLGFGGKGTCDSASATNGWWFAYDNRNNAKNFNYTCFGNSAGGYAGGGNNFGTITYTFNQGVWYHIAFTVTSSQAKLYINGKQEGATRTMTNLQLTDSTNNVNIGRMGGAYYHKGSLDDFKIFNYAKTAAQIKADYASRGQIKGTVASLGSSSKSSDALSNGLVGHWKTDEATWSGTLSEIVDSSGNGNHGQAQGASGGKAFPSSGKFGNAGFFEGVDDYLNIPDSTSLNVTGSQITVSAWVYPNSSTGRNIHLLYKYNNLGGYVLDLNTAGTVSFYIYNGTTYVQVGSTALAANTWTHITGTYNSTTGKINIYFNGVLNGSAVTNGNISTSSGGPLRYGYQGWQASSNYYFDGKMDEMRVYNRALSPKEVQDLYNWAPGPIGYWSMDENTGQTVGDGSGNGKNGTLGANSSVGTDDPTWKSGKYGSALNFDGSNDYVPAGSSTDYEITDEMTIEFWMYPRAHTANYVRPISKGGYLDNGWTIYTDVIGTNKLYPTFGINSGGGWSGAFAPSITYQLNQWQHIAVTVKLGSIGKSYLNGVSLGSVTPVTYYPTTTRTLRIGSEGGSFFNGMLDDVRIYNYARTQKQIVEDMNAGHPVGGSPVGSQVGYWKMDEGYGGTSYDTIGTKNGTLTNGTAGAIPTWTMDGKFGKGLTYSRTNKSYVNISGNNALCPTSLSISGWFNRTETGYQHSLLGNWWNGWGEIYVNTSNKLEWKWLESNGTTWHTLTTPLAISNNVWHHFAVTANKVTGLGYLYLDGVLQDSETAIVDLERGGNCNFASIGMSGENEANNPFWFSGFIDEVKIYSSALTDNEIKLDYDRGSAMVLGTSSNTSGLSGGSIASSSAAATYCVPGETVTCTPPIAEWGFDEKTGTTTNDSSGNGNTGTLTGAWTQGKIGSAVNLSSTTDNVNGGSGSVLDNIAIKTVEAWIYPRSFSNNAAPRIFDKTWLLSLGSTGYLNYNNAFSGTNGVYTSPTGSIVLNAWQHVAMVYDNSSASNQPIFYINGKLVATTVSTPAVGSAPDESAGNLILGNNAASGGVRALDGKLDQVKVFNYARSQSQVAWDYNQGKPIVHWKMDECQGSSLNDSSGFGNTGTITIGASGTQTAAGTCGTSGAWFGGVTGKLNYSLNLDGTDDYVSKASPANLPSEANPFSTSLWIKSSSGTSDLYILKWGLGGTSNAMNAVIYYGGTGSISHAFYANDLSSGANTVTSGAWNHFTVTFDGTTRRIYINGKQTATDTPAGVNVTANQTLYMGTYTGSGNYFPGQLDDVRIFNYGLTAAQVKNIYNDGAVKFGPVTGAP